jgi:8-oxo-dGTP diphosphatase
VNDPHSGTESRIEAVVAIIRRDDRYLFVRRSHHLAAGAGYWSPVSGRVEPGETEQAALKREVMEEVGLDVVADRKICCIPTPDGRFGLNFWTTSLVGGEARLVSDEASELRWVTLDEMRELEPRFDEDLEIVRGVADGRY